MPGVLLLHNVDVVEVCSRVIFLPVFNKEKYRPRVEKHMASTFNLLQKDLLFSEQEVWFASVQVSNNTLTSGS